MIDLFEIIGKFFFRWFFEIFLIWTGEIVLFCLTLGNHHPRWDTYLNERVNKYVIFSELSFWGGIVFWLGIAVLIHVIFFTQ